MSYIHNVYWTILGMHKNNLLSNPMCQTPRKQRKIHELTEVKGIFKVGKHSNTYAISTLQ